METMNFSVPYSQIVDMEGLDENYDCSVNLRLVSCDIIANTNSDGENKLLKCD